MASVFSIISSQVKHMQVGLQTRTLPVDRPPPDKRLFARQASEIYTCAPHGLQPLLSPTCLFSIAVTVDSSLLHHQRYLLYHIDLPSFRTEFYRSALHSFANASISFPALISSIG